MRLVELPSDATVKLVDSVGRVHDLEHGPFSHARDGEPRGAFRHAVWGPRGDNGIDLEPEEFARDRDMRHDSGWEAGARSGSSCVFLRLERHRLLFLPSARGSPVRATFEILESRGFDFKGLLKLQIPLKSFPAPRR